MNLFHFLTYLPSEVLAFKEDVENHSLLKNPSLLDNYYTHTHVHRIGNIILLESECPFLKKKTLSVLNVNF